MAPAGNFECLQAAIQGGANSVYFGVGQLNMRSHSANNFAPEDLAEVCRICREAGVKSYLTLNIVLYDEDLPAMRETLLAAREAGIAAATTHEDDSFVFWEEVFEDRDRFFVISGVIAVFLSKEGFASISAADGLW